MSQKTKQTQKTENIPQATFEDICPQWSKILSEAGGLSNLKSENLKSTDKMTLKRFDCCIVGEAHA